MFTLTNGEFSECKRGGTSDHDEGLEGDQAMATIINAFRNLELPPDLRKIIGLKPGEKPTVSADFMKKVLQTIEQNKDALELLKKY